MTISLLWMRHLLKSMQRQEPSLRLRPAQHTDRTVAIHYRHSAAPARAGVVRRVPGSIPLLPALARSLRAASVFLDLTPSKRQEGVRSGTLWLYSASKIDNRGGQFGNALGNPEPPPRPAAKPRPRFRVPQTPPASPSETATDPPH